MSRRSRKIKFAPRRPEPYGQVVHPLPTKEEAEEAEHRLAVYPQRLPGRPTLLTPDVEGRFLAALSKGMYRNVAAELCGLKPGTVEKWMKRGRGSIKDRPPSPEYVGFVRRVEQAEAMARGQVEVNLVARSKYDHNAGLAWLRTRYPDQWPRFPGGLDEEGPDGAPPFRAPAADTEALGAAPRVQMGPNILVLDRDKWPELASALIAQHRTSGEQRAKEEAVIIETQQEDPSVGVPRHGRLDALRADTTE
jgi:hypothetical protein